MTGMGTDGASELALIEAKHPLVVLDTDLIVIHVWWQEKYGRVPQWVREELRRQAPRVYLLAQPDLPWQPDPLRESPADRDRLLGVYRTTLDAYGQIDVPGRSKAVHPPSGEQ